MEQQQLVSNNISYSLLKSFDEHGPKALVERQTVYNKGIDFGSKLDDFISLPKEAFNEKYLIVQNTLDGDLFKLAEIIVNIENVNIDVFIEPFIEGVTLTNKIVVINQLAMEAELFKRIKLDTSRIKKFDTPEFYEFIEFMYNNKNKEFITPDEHSKLLVCQSSLFNHKSTKKYFNCGGNVEEIYQLELNFEYKNKNIKCILDKVIINHNNKTIQPIDLKSGSVSSKEFMSNFFKFKYYLQGTLYNAGVFNEYKKLINANYELLPFKYIYLPTFDYNNPKTFILTEKWEHAAWQGFTTNSGYKYRGITELVDEINWHIKHQIFNETREFYENLEIELDDSFINLI
jgi:hypothetical protein